MTAFAPAEPVAEDRSARGVTLVLPCLDEAASIQECVAEAFAAMADAEGPFEVLVVDNGSTDGSDRLAAAAGARVVHEPNPGYGNALRRGIAEATTPVVVMADADLTYELAKLPALVAPVLAGDADLVLGERLASATNESMPVLHRLVGTPVLSWLNRRAAPGLDVRDSQSGYRAFRRDAIVDLSLQGTGMEFASEMLIRAARAGLRISEVPTEYRTRAGESKLSTFRDGARHLRLIVLMAPHLLLRAPGVALFVSGLLLTALTLFNAGGVPIGGHEWRPVYLSTILLTVGALLALAGTAVKRFSPLAVPRPGPETLPHDRRALRTTAVAGAVAIAVGVAIDIALFLSERPADTAQRGALAGFATSLVIVGATMAVAGSLGRLLIAQVGYARAMTARTSADRGVG